MIRPYIVCHDCHKIQAIKPGAYQHCYNCRPGHNISIFTVIGTREELAALNGAHEDEYWKLGSSI